MKSFFDETISLLLETHPLDRVPRAGYLLRGVTEPESVAAHSFSLALLVMLVTDQYPEEYNKEKALTLALIHDIPECITMDIPMPAGNDIFKKEKTKAELEITQDIFGGTAFHQGKHYSALYQDLLEAGSPEARLVRGLDKVQMMCKVLAYEKENRGNLEEFWEYKDNFNNYGCPQTEELFNALFKKAGRTQ